jgi:glyoxylase-like metal-dependent hydrolase (beta-lactamase superfamily II)
MLEGGCKITKTIIQIDTGKFTNAFLIRGKTGCVLVDTGNPGKADRILERLAGHGVAPDDICLILLTHGHTDHFGSAVELRERTGAPVAIHALDADAVRQGIHQPDSLQPTRRLIAPLVRISALRNLVVPERAPAFEPDIVFEGEWRLDEYTSTLQRGSGQASLSVGDVAGRVIPTPGHTPGSVSVLLDSGQAIVGDMVIGGFLKLLRQPRLPIIAWDLERNWESLCRLLDLSPRIVYVGHGGPFKAEDLAVLIRAKH